MSFNLHSKFLTPRRELNSLGKYLIISSFLLAACGRFAVSRSEADHRSILVKHPPLEIQRHRGSTRGQELALKL